MRIDGACFGVFASVIFLCSVGQVLFPIHDCSWDYIEVTECRLTFPILFPSLGRI